MISKCHILAKPHQERSGIQKLKKSGVLNFHILDITAVHCTGMVAFT